ncbi:hypothetical protein JW877_02910 [bacterium]|nr:hypothetical protein [bacterium]
MSGIPSRKSSLKLFVLWASLQILVILITFNLFLFIGYKHFRSFLNQELEDNLNLVSRLLVSNISSEWIHQLEIDPRFYSPSRSEEIFADLLEQQKLSNIFILDTLGYTLYSFDWSLPLGEKNPYLTLDYNAFNLSLTGIPNASKIYESNDRYSKTGYAPLYDKYKNVIAVLGIEAGDEYFNILRIARKGLILFAILSIASILMIVVLTLIISGVLKKTERTLVKTATLSTMGEMAFMMAHEIRNPLTIMKLSVEELENHVSSQQKEWTLFIKEEIDRLNSLVEGYLSLSSKSPSIHQNADIGEVAGEIVARMEPELIKAGINIVKDIKPTSPVNIAPNALKQVILNIILNARDAIHGEGQITVKTYTRNRKGRPFSVLSLKDSGEGIPRKNLKKVFELTFSTKPQGSGLGLFLTQKIINDHDGFIEIISRKNQGTEVLLGFPQVEEA